MSGRVRTRTVVLATATGAAAVAVAGAAAHVTAPTAATVKVVEKEFSVKPTPATVKPGKVTFNVRNTGKVDHELVVIKTTKAPGKLPIKGTRASETGRVGRVGPIKPGKTKSLVLTLKAGKYVLLCNLPAHYKAGQFAAFRVAS